MDLFDMTETALIDAGLIYDQELESTSPEPANTSLKPHPPPNNPPPHLSDLASGMRRLANIPTLVLGVQSDILFPVEQQREIADALRMTGNQQVRYYELGGVWGHDTFL